VAVATVYVLLMMDAESTRNMWSDYTVNKKDCLTLHLDDGTTNIKFIKTDVWGIRCADRR
jgi:hypothetical protein